MTFACSNEEAKFRQPQSADDKVQTDDKMQTTKCRLQNVDRRQNADKEKNTNIEINTFQEKIYTDLHLKVKRQRNF